MHRPNYVLIETVEVLTEQSLSTLDCFLFNYHLPLAYSMSK